MRLANRRTGLIAALMCWFTPGALCSCFGLRLRGVRLRHAGQHRRLHRRVGRHRRPAADETNDACCSARSPDSDSGCIRCSSRRCSRWSPWCSGSIDAARRLGRRHARRAARMPAAPGLERRQRLAVARRARRRRGHLRRTFPHLLRRPPPASVRPARPRPRLAARRCLGPLALRRPDRARGLRHRRTVSAGPAPAAACLLLVVLVAVFPIMALFENLIFANDGRYGIISFPFLLLAMAIAVDELTGRRPPARAPRRDRPSSRRVDVGVRPPDRRPSLDELGTDPNAPLTAIVERLDEVGIDRIYGSYWAVHPVDFVGDNASSVRCSRSGRSGSPTANGPSAPLRPSRSPCCTSRPMRTRRSCCCRSRPTSARCIGDFVLYLPTSAAATAGN